jgi:predicted MFS family arabinose efflux permease
MVADRAIVALLSMVMFTSGADLLVMTPILPTLAEELGVGADLGGLWITAYAVATGVFALAFGPVSDRFGRRAVLRTGLMVLVAGTLACAVSESFSGMLGARFLAGAGAGMLVTSTTSYAGDHFEPERRAVVMGWVMAGFFLALILAVPIGAFLTDILGWSRMFLVLAGFASLVGLGVLSLPRPRLEQRSARLSVRAAARTYGELLRDRRVVGVLMMSLTVGLAMTMFSVYSSPWMHETFGLDTADRGLVYAAGGPAVLLGGPLAGRLSNHFGRVSLVMAGSALMGLMQLAMPLTGDASAHLRTLSALDGFSRFGDLPWPMALPPVLVFFLAMAAGATRSGPFQTLALEVAPGERRGAVSALRNGFNQLGSGLGAALGGFLWSTLDPAYGTICVTAALVTFAGTALLRVLVGSDRPLPGADPDRLGSAAPGAGDG